MSEELLPQKEMEFVSRGLTPVPERTKEYLRERNRMIGGVEESITDLLSFEPFTKMAAKKTKASTIPRTHPFKFFVDAIKEKNTFNKHPGD